MQKPSMKQLMAAQVCLRILASASTLAAAWIVFTSNQSALVFGIKLEARYTYSSAFKFFVYANLVACVMSVLSSVILIAWKANALRTNTYFYAFLHDLVMMSLLMGASAAATSIGYVGRYGNSHSGWLPICENFSKFCNKLTISVVLSYFSFFFYLCLTIISANIHHISA